MVVAVLWMATAATTAKPVDYEIGGTKVSVEFYTPGIVRVVKAPVGHDYEKKSLVVTAEPQDVIVRQSGNTLQSSLLTVRIDGRTGALTFAAKGRTLLREKHGATFDERANGPDRGSYRVAQTFLLDRDEAIYGLGTIQNGKVTVTLPITNTGKREGTETMQVYVKRLGDADAPIKALKGFQKLSLKPGETKTATVVLDGEAFEYYDEAIDELSVYAGNYQILVGTSSLDRDLQAFDFVVK